MKTRVKFLWYTSGQINITKLLNTDLKHWNKCEFYIHLRNMYKNKWDSDFPICSGLKVAGPILAAQGTRQGQPRTRRPSVAGTHTHTLRWDSAGTPVHLPARLGCGRKPETPEKTNRWGKCADSTQTVAPARSQFFFSLINVLIKRHYLRACCTYWGGAGTK